MTLRARLLLGVTVVLLLGLATAATASTLLLRDYLHGRTDSQLDAARGVVVARSDALLALSTDNSPSTLFGRLIAPTDYVVEVQPPTGAVIRLAGGAGQPPDRLLLSYVADPAARKGARPFTIGTAEGDYRAELTALSGSDGYALVAVPLEPVEAAVRRLIIVETIVAAMVLGLVAAGVWLVIRRGLRPLDDVVATADTIAAGDLSHRAPIGSPNTETGRLAVAFNAMLGEVEESFSAQQRSEDRLRRFVADASHELRTPLTAVRGYADLLLSGAIPPGSVPDAVGRIRAEAIRMGSLVEDLLLLARQDEGRPLRADDVDLIALVEDAVAAARAADPTAVLSADLRPARIIGDADALRRVVDNLLANVRMHTPPGTACTVSVRTGETVVLTVADRGPGLAETDVGRVFDRFYRADTGRDRDSGGSGLGLSIVASLIRAHHGTATLTAAPGTGTIVTLTLPHT